MRPKAGLLYATVLAFSLAILYGSTYQQFRFFSLDAPGGPSDEIQYGFSILLCLLGVCAFASSRITVLVIATPVADAAYFCAIATLLYFCVARKLLLLAPPRTVH